MNENFILGQFKAHLKEHNILFETYLYYNKHRDKNHCDFNYLLKNDPGCLLIHAFRWCDTKKGSDFGMI